MNLKTKKKNFFTPSRKANSGFTLVELIVVIAILAILAGVGVPAYSGYVKKANMQADRTLISEIEHALTLAYYSGELAEKESGYVLLTPICSIQDFIENPDMEGADFIYISGSGTATALRNSFGDNWASAIQLKYDGWDKTSTTLSQDEAQKVKDSNFEKHYTREELMAEVQALTKAVNALTNQDILTLEEMYIDKATGEDVIALAAEAYGIKKNWGEMNPEEKANMLVLATAYSIDQDNCSVSAEQPLTIYAGLAAYAASDPDFDRDVYQPFKNTLDNEEADLEDIKAAWRTLNTDATNHTEYMKWIASGDGQANQEAFSIIMKSVGDVATENSETVSSALGDKNMFTSGVGYELYNDYMNSVYATAGLSVDLNSLLETVGTQLSPGCVYVYYSIIDGSLYVDNTIAA